MFSDDEVQLLSISEESLDLLEEGFIQTALTFALWGLVLAGTVQSFRILSLCGMRRSKFILLSLVIFLFASSTVLSVLYANCWVMFVHTLAPQSEHVHHLLNRTYIASAWITRVMYFLSECVLVWRAWVLWADTSVVKGTLVISLAVTWAAGLADIILTTLSILDETQRARLEGLNLRLLMFVPLIATNVISTFLIALKAWYWRDEVKAYVTLREDGISCAFEKSVFLLTETGIFYILIWVIYLLTDYRVFPSTTACNAWEIVVNYHAAIYAMSIILIVAHRRSCKDAIKSGVDILAMQFADTRDDKWARSTTTISDIHFKPRTSLETRLPEKSHRESISLGE